MKCIKFDYEKDFIKDFINFPKKIYTKSENTENPKEVYKLLTDIHPLSKYFHLDKFIVYDDNENIVGRFCLTSYPNDEVLYFGLFECVNDHKVAKLIFDEAYKFAKDNGYKTLVGPYDCSFWIKYRLKINLFEEPYTIEPYNKDYYYEFFLENDFEVIEHYTSQKYSKIEKDYHNGVFEEKLAKYKEKGYIIKSPTISEYDKVFEEIYHLMTELYSDFPFYKHVEWDDFKPVFLSYKKILNLKMVKIAYFDNKLVGFFVSVPNFGNKVYHLNIFNILNIQKIKRNPKSYVMLHMGVHIDHRGLGGALVGAIEEELKQNGASSIGALAGDGKVTQNYASELIKDKYEYVLLERKIK